MQAITNDHYGSADALELRELDAPLPADNEVIVRVRASSIASGDRHLLGGKQLAIRLYWGLFEPRRKVLGWDVAGVIESIGAKVTDWKVGDEVFGETAIGGGWAGLARVPSTHLAAAPESLSLEDAASIPVGALTALQAVRDQGRVHAGASVLIHGASGGVGMFAVQLAKHFGGRVTGSCSTSKADFVRELGADETLDYRKQDITRLETRYDAFIDLVGDKPISACKRLPTKDGVCVCLAGPVSRTIRASIFGGRRVATMIAKPNRADLEALRELINTDALRVVIDRRFPMSDAAEAVRYAQSGAARGRVLLTMP
jgi:NADPH:quinone reductase-like Zn-dependent oxidoreductase